MFNHERDYRGQAAETQIKNTFIMVMGCGAIGANLALTLCRSGFRMFGLLDKDRVEHPNLGTQPWDLRDVGTLKTNALSDKLYGKIGRAHV